MCEYLREYGIPFIAAGRSADKLNAAMKAHVAGIETADCEVIAAALKATEGINDAERYAARCSRRC